MMLGLLIVGGCIEGCWQLQQASFPTPCKVVGQRLGLEDIAQHVERGNMRPAYCSGKHPRTGRYIQFRAR
jgi:hypothetical protein